jgi:hypothetical protein
MFALQIHLSRIPVKMLRITLSGRRSRPGTSNSRFGKLGQSSRYMDRELTAECRRFWLSLNGLSANDICRDIVKVVDIFGIGRNEQPGHDCAHPACARCS